MAFTSNQINQMMAGQQAMFANHAAYAHNIGAQAGFGGAPQQLQSVNFGTDPGPGGYGSAAVGALGMALPGAMTGVSLAGGLGLLGARGGYLDPFTGVGRAFMGGLGSAGGLSGGGVGALGAGLRAAALPALGYYAGYKAISHVGEQIYQGAANIGAVGGMAQSYFGPQYGEAGSRPGGQMSRGQIQNITSVLHEVASDDTMSTMREMMQVMDKAGRFGMLTGINNAGEFKRKFKDIVDKASTIAKVLGTTIEEAMPALSGFNQMGLWTAKDVMGASLAMKQVGPQGAVALQQNMMMGARQSHAMGGSLAAGATLAQNQFLNVSAAVRFGALTDQMVTEYTGGVGGVEGQQMLAGSLTSSMQMMARTPVGRLTMAGLGEVVDGKFTGRIDQKRLAAFQRGEISVGDLQRLGQQTARTREGAASYTYKAGQIGQELMAQGGMEVVGGMFQQGLARAGFLGASEDIQGIMLQKLYGLNERDAMMMQKLLKKMPEIQETKSRRELDALKQALSGAEEKQNRSWDGLMRSIEGAADNSAMVRGLQEMGERLSTSLSENVDDISDYIHGRVRQLNMTNQDRMRRMLSSSGPSSAVQSAASLYTQSSAMGQFGSTGLAQRIRNEGVLGGTASAAFALFGNEQGMGTRAQMLASSGARTGSEGIPYMGDSKISYAEAERVSQGVRFRGAAPTVSGAFSEGAASTQALSKVQAAYSRMMGDVRNREKFRNAKREMSPHKYQEFVASQLMLYGGVGDEISVLQKNSARGSVSSMETILDAIAVGKGESQYDIDFGKVAQELGTGQLRTGEQFSEELDKRVSELMTGLAGTQTTTIEGFGGRGNRVLQSAKRNVGVTAKQLREAITERGQLSEELVAFMQSGDTSIDPRKYPELAGADAKGDPSVSKVLDAIGKMDGEERANFANMAKKTGNVGALIDGMIYAETVTEQGQFAGAELAALGKRGGSQSLRRILGAFSAAGEQGDVAAYDRAKKQALRYAQNLKGDAGSEQIRRLRASGGAVADHIADLAEIERLDPMSLKDRSGGEVAHMLMQRGLGDEIATGMAALPEAEKKKLEAALESKKVTEEQANFLKKTLQKIEQKIGLESSKVARDDSQRKLTAALAQFVGANEKFVLAVSAAVPALSELEAQDILDKARSVSQNQSTSEG